MDQDCSLQEKGQELLVYLAEAALVGYKTCNINFLLMYIS